MKEKFILNEDIQENANLPDVELEEPITISDTKFELEEPSEDVIINANVGLINDLISREWELINEYKSIIATLELNNQEELIKILNNVVDEKTIQLGMLNKAVEVLDNSSIDLMKQGEEKAEEILAETEFPLDESLQEHFTSDEFNEYMKLCRILEIETIKDLMEFSQEHGNVKDKALLQAMRDEVKSLNKEEK